MTGISELAGAHGPGAQRRGVRTLAALGVVFGDIGTSPLYAFRECMSPRHGIAPTQDNILGVLSLILWTLILVVTVKYVTFIMRADNEGEGGIFALLALVPERLRATSSTRIRWIAGLVVFGAALLYGDGGITPAISVLSAMEGLEVATHVLRPAVVPLTCVVLMILFGVQRSGTAGIGSVFGPIMTLWFTALALLGLSHILANTAVLRAINPVHAARFFAGSGFYGFAVLGAVVLAITGAEALYADLGHFGRGPIRRAWYGVVFPALVLNYLGQGALLLTRPEAAENPFFSMVPQGALTYALVALSTMATVIASQSLISGAFSMTQQAVQLGFLPWFTIRHTSSEAEGQIYVPAVNWPLAVVCLALVLTFRASTRLAGAYGIAVTGTMTITSIVYFVVVRWTWRWSLAVALALLVLFLAMDLPFLGANLLKFSEGGYIPIFVGAALFALMMIWRRGRSLLAQSAAGSSRPLGAFLLELDERHPVRVPGTAVFLTRSREAPAILSHHLKHNKALHETVVLLTATTEHVPRVPAERRVELKPLGKGFIRVLIHSGFMQQPHVPSCLEHAAAKHGVRIDFTDITYYIARETFLATNRGEMGRVTERIFAFMARNAARPTDYFELPPDRVVELGIQIDL